MRTASRLAPILLGVLAAALLLVHTAHYGTTWTDDAYITFRYVRMFAAGHGMAFNPGERLEGITNLGWALILAPFGDGDLLTVAQILGVLSGLATVATLVAWARAEGLGIVATGIALATLVFPAWVPLWLLQGLETPAVMLLLTVGWSRYRAELRADRGPLLAGLALGLAPWLRPDAALLPILLGAWHLRRGASAGSSGGRWGGRRAAMSAGIVVVCGLALVALKLWWFGELLPNTFHVKVDHFPPDRGLAYLWSFLTVPSPWLPAVLGLAVARAFAWAWRRDDRAIPGLVFAAWVVAAVLQNGDFMPNYRLLVPVWPAACAALALAVDDLLARVRARADGAAATTRVPLGRAAAVLSGPVLAAAAVVTVTAFVLVPEAETFYLDELNRVGGATHQPLYPARKKVALLTPWKSTRWGRGPVAQVPFPTAWAVVNAGADEVVAYTELGLISYVHEGPILDLLGLTDRVMAGRDGQTWPAQWAYLQDRVTWLIVNTQTGEWPRLHAPLADAHWKLVDGCNETWVFENPARVGTTHPPDTAEIERRLALALARAPRHDALHEALAHELVRAHATAPLEAFVAKAEALRTSSSPSADRLRCDLGLAPGCTARPETCADGQVRVDTARMADPSTWPVPPADQLPPEPTAPPVGTDEVLGPAGEVVAPPGDAKGPATPAAGEPACVAARAHAAEAWNATREAWVGHRGEGTDEPRRLAREAGTAARVGGDEALAAAHAAAKAAGAVHGASDATASAEAALAASQAAAAACGD